MHGIVFHRQLISTSFPIVFLSVVIHYSWRPVSPDPGDEHVIDCAMNAGATVITSNVRDFERAKDALGLHVMTPAEAIVQLAGWMSH